MLFILVFGEEIEAKSTECATDALLLTNALQH